VYCTQNQVKPKYARSACPSIALLGTCLASRVTSYNSFHSRPNENTLSSSLFEQGHHCRPSTQLPSRDSVIIYSSIIDISRELETCIGCLKYSTESSTVPVDYSCDQHARLIVEICPVALAPARAQGIAVIIL